MKCIRIPSVSVRNYDHILFFTFLYHDLSIIRFNSRKRKKERSRGTTYSIRARAWQSILFQKQVIHALFLWFSSHVFKSNKCRHLKQGYNYLCSHTNVCGSNAEFFVFKLNYPAFKWIRFAFAQNYTPNLSFVSCFFFFFILGFPVW